MFEQDSWKRYKDEMVLHCREFSPELCQVLENDQLHVAVRNAMSRAANHGFTNRGPIRLFIEMMLLFGTGFDNDPQYPRFMQILAGENDQMIRADQLYNEVVQYQKEVSGDNGVNTMKAYRRLLSLSSRTMHFSEDSFQPDMIHGMAEVFPEKASYLGVNALGNLIRKGTGIAAGAGIPMGRGHALLVWLMYMMGHECCSDPLYPWISATLNSQGMKDAETRTHRLEQKCITWLNQVLINFSPIDQNE